MNADLASKLAKEMLDITKRLNSALQEIQDQCPEGEFKSYRLAFGTAMAEIYLHILDRIFEQHPHLRPPELKLDRDKRPD